MATVIGQDQVQGAGPGHGQHDQDGLGPVGHRGQGVEREGREPLDRGDLLLGRLAAAQGRPDHQAPDGAGRVGSRLVGVHWRRA